MIKANKRMKPADVTAIRRCDMGTRNKRKTGTKRIPMTVETSKARPAVPMPASENLVTRGSGVGLSSSLLLRMFFDSLALCELPLTAVVLLEEIHVL